MLSRLRMMVAVVTSIVMVLSAPGSAAIPGLLPLIDGFVKHPAKKKAAAKKKKLPSRGTIEGVVLNRYGRPVAGARVRLGHGPTHHVTSVVHHVVRGTVSRGVSISHRSNGTVHHLSGASTHHNVHGGKVSNPHLVHSPHMTIHPSKPTSSGKKTLKITAKPATTHVRRGGNKHAHVVTTVRTTGTTSTRTHHHRPHAHHGGVVTGRNGHFKFKSVRPGHHELHATRHHGGNGNAFVEVRRGSTSHVTIRLGSHSHLSHVRRGGNVHIRR